MEMNYEPLPVLSYPHVIVGLCISLGMQQGDDVGNKNKSGGKSEHSSIPNTTHRREACGVWSPLPPCHQPPRPAIVPTLTLTLTVSLSHCYCRTHAQHT